MINFTYKWKLSDLKNVKKNNLKVFSCFACGGGSTMGYKMSGFDVIGCNEIDPEMIKIYKKNHNPKYSFLESIETFKSRNDLPEALYNLDILDGSPPCSSFSMAGSREKKWGVNKKFREGQEKQVLDDLFFHYIDLAEKLNPKIIIAENVKGMIQGNAKGYVKEVIKRFKSIGYTVQLFLLNGATMGLPQKRERIFFVCRRNDLGFSDLSLSFNEKPISVYSSFKSIENINYKGKSFSESSMIKYYKKCLPGESFSKYHEKGSLFGLFKISKNNPCATITSKDYQVWHYDTARALSIPELCVISSFPLDYKFKKKLEKYQMGMSVPPLMMHKISQQIYEQWFKYV